MAQQRSRAQLQAEIERLDGQINEIVRDMPSAALRTQGVPGTLWGLAAVLIAGGLWAMGKLPFRAPRVIIETIGGYSIVILIVGCVFAVLALVNTYRAFFGKEKRQSKRFHVEAAKVETLKKQRQILAQQISQLKG